LLVHVDNVFFWQDVRRTLPPEVDSLDEATRIALAMQVEERNCLQAEIDLASRRCRYNTFTSHHHGLTATNLQKKLEKVSQAVSVSIADAIKNHKASKLPHNTNVQNPNAGGKFFFPLKWAAANSSLTGSPVQAKGIPGRPAATNFQSVIIVQWLQKPISCSTGLTNSLSLPMRPICSHRKLPMARICPIPVLVAMVSLFRTSKSATAHLRF
jgi:hypothetical protein